MSSRGDPRLWHCGTDHYLRSLTCAGSCPIHASAVLRASDLNRGSPCTSRHQQQYLPACWWSRWRLMLRRRRCLARQMGRPLSRQTPPGFDQTQEDVGTLQGNERFIRRNRRPTDFVGPDLRELQRFIGILQATPRGPVTPDHRGSAASRRSFGDHESATASEPDRPDVLSPVWRSISVLPRLPRQPGSLESNASGYAGSISSDERVQPYRGVHGRADCHPAG